MAQTARRCCENAESVVDIGIDTKSIAQTVASLQAEHTADRAHASPARRKTDGGTAVQLPCTSRSRGWSGQHAGEQSGKCPDNRGAVHGVLCITHRSIAFHWLT